MNKTQIRSLALALLDDSHGIGIDAYDIVEKALKESGNDDIVEKVHRADDRFFLLEADAEELSAKE